MATKAQLRAACGSAWHTNAEAIYDCLGSDGSIGGGAAGSFAAVTCTNLTATGNVALGDAITDTLSFFGYTPVAQRASASQAAFTAQTLTAIASITLSAVGTGSLAGIWGFSSSTVGKSIRTQVNKVITDQVKQNILLFRMRADLVAYGLVKGAA